MSVFTEEENDEEFHLSGRDVWAEHEAKKQRDPLWFEKKNKMELIRSNPSYTIDAERKRVQRKLDDEKRMKDYRTQFPNVVKTIRIIGDQAYGILFTGEADLLAYQVRNFMKLNNLKQSQGMRPFPDGTRIIVQSVFGHDIITIDVSRSTGEEEPTSKVAQKQCNITFINLPVKVQPMKYPDGIESGEVEGTDYIKTYYTFDVGQCSDCEDVKMDFFFDYAVPKENRHHDDELNNHCIHSYFPPCWGKVIDHGRDEGGDYFIWKAFTEKPYSVTLYSRTGLGILDLKASIIDSAGQVICDLDQKIDVDCCLKDDLLRKVEIWWDNCSGYCKMEGAISVADLVAYSNSGGTLYAILGDDGGCIPFVWSLSGPGTIIPSGENGTEAIYTPGQSGCNDPLTLMLRDRCGTSYAVDLTSCCDGALPLGINYSSLQMSCGQQQDLAASGGCGPYSWAVTSGSLSASTGNSVTYTAPATNPNCEDNPTITVTDCCGSTAQIQLAVNCYAGNDPALGLVAMVVHFCRVCTDCSCGCCSISLHNQEWNCAGVIVVDCSSGPSACTVGDYNTDCDNACFPAGAACKGLTCNSAQCGCIKQNPACPCNTLIDGRTADMKTQGCCPLNPLTGLPF